MKNKYRIGLLVSFLMIIGCNDVGRYQTIYYEEDDAFLLIDSKTGDLYTSKDVIGIKIIDIGVGINVDVEKWVLIQTLDDKLVKEKPKEISE